ncbi:TIGR00725 family protein [Acetivibrio clariflavus]|uniref:TIGR00725 family protein n=1 Tax=Acetivibrio clariflavus (strain DSM 19732 / NBRC 101661 / EBR45) TaxID=720554 RepID=G8LTU3_ACECE|nr:TIGR00725 family protein [Acetivibrio clariflavus]AEV67289.1 TIGR00725 family protein [Acetivibrio clariflavus DSM 19732]
MYFAVGVAAAADCCNKEIENIAFEFGQQIAKRGYAIVCGGMEGLMEQVCRGARTVMNRKPVVGILPGSTKLEANPYTDIVIPTTLGYIRNVLIPISSDVLVAFNGGAGTLSEITYAWQYDKPIILMAHTGGWSEKLANTPLDHRKGKILKTAYSNDEALAFIDEIFNKWKKECVNI